MSKELYRSAERLSIGGARGMYVVRKTRKGISVQSRSLYTDYPDRIEFYRDGSYPALPTNWSKPINEYGITAADAWHQDIMYCTPYRTLAI